MFPTLVALCHCSKDFNQWLIQDATDNEVKLKREVSAIICSASFDCLAFISTLVVGILGLLGIISMPPAAAYACIGVSGTILLSYISLAIAQCVSYCKPITTYTPIADLSD